MHRMHQVGRRPTSASGLSSGLTMLGFHACRPLSLDILDASHLNPSPAKRPDRMMNTGCFMVMLQPPAPDGTMNTGCFMAMLQPPAPASPSAVCYRGTHNHATATCITLSCLGNEECYRGAHSHATATHYSHATGITVGRSGTHSRTTGRVGVPVLAVPGDGDQVASVCRVRQQQRFRNIPRGFGTPTHTPEWAGRRASGIRQLPPGLPRQPVF